MDRLRGIGSFLLIVTLIFLGLRGVHMMIGFAYPSSLPGPFHLQSLDEVEPRAGFSPHIPFYRPIHLGNAPVEVVVERRPTPKSRVVWHGQSFLELTEWSGSDRPPVAESATPLPDHPQALHWTSDGMQIAVIQLADRWVQVRTDLDLVELRRIIDTLLPYDRLL